MALDKELPYELAVLIEDYKEFPDITKIQATIIVNRPSQRAIVVGTKGTKIKEIGTKARKRIETMVGGRVNLNLHVKVKPKWFRDHLLLEQLDLPRTTRSARVWRQK